MQSHLDLIFEILAPLNAAYAYLKQFTNFNIDFLKMAISQYLSFLGTPHFEQSNQIYAKYTSI